MQQKCAGFLACMAAFTRKYPAEFVDSVAPGIVKTFLAAIVKLFRRKYRVSVNPWPNDSCLRHLFLPLRFMLRHCDDDILKMLQQSAPPADVDKIDCFRNAGRKYMKQARGAKETYSL